MEVSKRALLALAAVAIGAGVWLALRESTHDRPRPLLRTPERAAARALADSVTRLGLRVQAADVRRRVDSALQEFAPARAPRVIVLGGGSAVVPARMTDSLVGTLHAPADAAVPMRLALVEAPPAWLDRRAYVSTFAIIPGDVPGSVCTAVRVVYPDVFEERGELGSWLRLPWDGAVGPCWYLASFGFPGQAIRAWLDSRYWDVAGAIPPHPRRISFEDNYETEPNLFYRILGDFRQRYAGGSATLQGCASDKPVLCEAALLGSPFPPGLLPEGIVGNERLNRYAVGAYQWMTGVPPWASRELLAMMVEDLGPARFSAFWTSQAPVPEAFHAAAGVPFGEWYRNQLRRELTRAGVADPGKSVSWPSAIGLVALALGASLWGARRRQVH